MCNYQVGDFFKDILSFICFEPLIFQVLNNSYYSRIPAEYLLQFQVLGCHGGSRGYKCKLNVKLLSFFAAISYQRIVIIMAMAIDEKLIPQWNHKPFEWNTMKPFCNIAQLDFSWLCYPDIFPCIMTYNTSYFALS